MKVFIKDLIKNETREADTKGLTIKQWVRVNFCGWGFYTIVYNGKSYEVFDKLAKNVKCYEISSKLV